MDGGRGEQTLDGRTEHGRDAETRGLPPIPGSCPRECRAHKGPEVKRISFVSVHPYHENPGSSVRQASNTSAAP
eukprot:5647915-Prymnesium_polylepis.3